MSSSDDREQRREARIVDAADETAETLVQGNALAAKAALAALLAEHERNRAHLERIYEALGREPGADAGSGTGIRGRLGRLEEHQLFLLAELHNLRHHVQDATRASAPVAVGASTAGGAAAIAHAVMAALEGVPPVMRIAITAIAALAVGGLSFFQQQAAGRLPEIKNPPPTLGQKRRPNPAEVVSRVARGKDPPDAG